MNNILILGGSSFIGKNIVELFSADKACNLIIVTRNSELLSNVIFLKENVLIKIASISNVDFIEKLIEEFNINSIIHLISNLIPSSTDKEFYNGLNEVVIPTFKLIDFIANKNIKFIFFSSGGTIYGNFPNKLKESSNLNPINNYGFSKLIIEDYIKFKSNTSKLQYVILRPSNVYGKYQRFEANQGFISVAINKIQNDIPIEIWGDGKSVRDYIHVQDVVLLTKQLLTKRLSNRYLNISTGVGFSLLEIIKIIEHRLNKKAKINFNNRRDVDAISVILDNSQLLKILDHQFIDIQEGVNKQIDYFNQTIINVK
jgi:UDP-glucose 4-epimerase